jgi:hypothetical protein
VYQEPVNTCAIKKIFDSEEKRPRKCVFLHTTFKREANFHFTIVSIVTVITSDKNCTRTPIQAASAHYEEDNREA